MRVPAEMPVLQEQVVLWPVLLQPELRLPEVQEVLLLLAGSSVIRAELRRYYGSQILLPVVLLPLLPEMAAPVEKVAPEEMARLAQIRMLVSSVQPAAQVAPAENVMLADWWDLLVDLRLERWII